MHRARHAKHTHTCTKHALPIQQACNLESLASFGTTPVTTFPQTQGGREGVCFPWKVLLSLKRQIYTCHHA
jgi:hypothetical protein